MRYGHSRGTGKARGIADDRAAAVIEFALVVPVLLVIVWGAMSLSRAYQRLNILTLSLRDGARYAATMTPVINPSAVTDVQAHVDSISTVAGFTINGASVDVTYFMPDSVRVRVSNYALFSGLSGGLGTVDRASVFRIEQP